MILSSSKLTNMIRFLFVRWNEVLGGHSIRASVHLGKSHHMSLSVTFHPLLISNLMNLSFSCYLKHKWSSGIGGLRMSEVPSLMYSMKYQFHNMLPRINTKPNVFFFFFLTCLSHWLLDVTLFGFVQARSEAWSLCVCLFGLGWKMKIILLFSLILLLFMGFITLYYFN